MKFKDFLRSNAFRCIIVLLVITIVCGAILALCNDLFYVSDREMFERSIVKIYDGDASQLIDLIPDDADEIKYTTYNCEAVILDAHKSPDGKTWLVQSKGNKCGYQNGSVTLWVNMSVDGGELTAINKVIVDSYDSSQTLIGSISETYLAQYASEKYSDVVTGGGHFSNVKMSSDETTDENEMVASGATYTSKAVNAAVNGAMDYVREFAKEGV